MLKWIKKLHNTLTGLTNALKRFPLTTLFLLAAAIVNAYNISTGKDISKLLISFIVGIFLSVLSQVLYERFFTNFTSRITLQVSAVILTAGYYLMIMPDPEQSIEVYIRSSVVLFTLLIAFIWVPVIKSIISFNKSFIIVFKAFFSSLFFSGIILLGISLILTAMNLLIVSIDFQVYLHTANLVYFLFAPIYFLSFIPVYPQKMKTAEKLNIQIETINKAAYGPKFLEILISYILIPLIAIYTIILVIYLIKNIDGPFWTNNLLEPMIIAYSITVIFIYLLASEILNKFTGFYKKCFPKVLVPIVLFQITSSIITISSEGVTHTRYYVILFGIFAAVAGILLSFLPVQKNGIIAPIVIIFAVISILPPVDAFTVSRISQTDILKSVLIKNKMLQHNKIIPNSSISTKDKTLIINTVQYLSMMGYTKEIKWFPNKANEDFYHTFGFNEEQNPVNQNQPIYLTLIQAPINIQGFDTFMQTDINLSVTNKVEKIGDIKKQGKRYTLLQNSERNQFVVKLLKENNQELISFNIQKIFDRFSTYNSIKNQISLQEATFTAENNRAKITILVQNAGVDKENAQNNNAHLFIFIQIK